MRSITTVGIILGFVSPLFAGWQPSDFLHGRTDREIPVYAPGEKMTFRFNLIGFDGLDRRAHRLVWERTGDDGLKENGVASAAEPLELTTSLDRPGFVRYYVELRDAADKPVLRSSGERKVYFDGGAGVDILKIRQGAPEPKDFDAFWARRKAILASVPWRDGVVLKKLDSRRADVDLYAVSIPCAGGNPTTGFLSLPTAAKNGARFPASVSFHGHGASWSMGATMPPGPSRLPNDAISFVVTAHGFELMREKGYYADLRKKADSNGYDYAFDPAQNADPEKAYFSGMTYRIMRALEYLKSRPEWNGRDLQAIGGSMGGLQTIWAAALDPAVTDARADIPWCCDIGGTEVGRNRGDWYVKWVPALGYYDPVNMARRIPKTCRVRVIRAGLGDYVCPPTGVMAFYNNLTCPKALWFLQGSTHGYLPPQPNQVTWVVGETVEASRYNPERQLVERYPSGRADCDDNYYGLFNGTVPPFAYGRVVRWLEEQGRDLSDFRKNKCVALVEDGVAKCRIVVEEGTPPSAAFGAKEIAKYFQKATGAKVEVEEGLGQRSRSTVDGLIPIRIALNSNNKTLPPESFEIAVAPSEVTIRGVDARGVLYGCYEILKRWAGMRWLEQGEQGEYCIHRGKTIFAPIGKISETPRLMVRSFRTEEPEDWLWAARNNMQVDLTSWDITRPRKGYDYTATDLAASSLSVSGHCLTPLLCAHTNDRKLFEAHPEYFCLVKGKRVPSRRDGYGPNPCTSNPTVLDLIASNLLVSLNSAATPPSCRAIIGNDDNMQWCECDRCRALDPTETAKSTRGRRADRYWWTVNEIARRVWAKRPDAMLGGWAYQDFWLPPVRVKPDPRLALMLSFNDQCWRHAADDPTCPINSEMARIYRLWKPFGLRLVMNRSEFSCEGCPGGTYAPAEWVIRQNYLAFPAIGCQGDFLCVRGPTQPRVPWEDKTPWFYPPYHGKNLKWHAVWQAMYVAARQGWSTKRDYEGELEEANALYYGKAWDGGMREFRALQTRLYYGAEGCQHWPQSNPIAKCLDESGSEEKLRALMAKAVKAAEEERTKARGEEVKVRGEGQQRKVREAERALEHTLQAQEIFEKTWLTERPKYLRLEKGLVAKRTAGRIAVDGVLDEADWKNASPVGDFVLVGCGDRVDPGTETSVRATYDDENVYFGIECRDVDTSVLRGGTVGRDSWKGLGDHVEIMCSSPSLAPKTCVLAINWKGGLHDRMTLDATGAGDETWRTKGAWAVKVEKDRWFVEASLPLAELGGAPKPNEPWRVNCVRTRDSKNVRNHRGASSLSCGVVHGADNYMKLRFRNGGRKVTPLAEGWTADGVPVTLPHTWNAEDAADGVGRAPDWVQVGYSSGATSYVRKVATYRRTLPAAQAGRRYFVRCDGASVKAEVRVNGKTIGSHVGAFTGFTYEATDAMKAGENVLEIVVDSRVDWDVQPIHADFSVYGGLYRVPELIETGRDCIDPRRTPVVHADPKTGKVTVDFVVSGSAAGEGARSTEFVIPDFELWSPENPRLYPVTVRFADDEITLKVGFRTAEFRADGFYLNGVRRKLRGVCRHQDREGRGWARTREDEAEDVRWIKRMGADAVRTSHYPQSPAFLDLCDEMGLLVWEEVPNVNGLTFTERARANGLNEAREMVEQHRNHPCVFAWGLFNEIYNKAMPEAPEPRLAEIRDLIHSLDATRRVVAASSQPDKTALNAVPDELGFNLYPGWYGRRADQMNLEIDDCFKANPSRRTIAVSEYGCSGSVTQHADPKYRSRSTASDFHPEEYEAYLHHGNYSGIVRDDRVWGSFLWVMFDLGSDARNEGPRYGINDKGLVTWDRSTAKDAFYFYKANWNPEPMLHLVGQRMTEQTTAKATVMAFSTVGAVKLFVNGRLVGEKAPDAVKTAIWEDVPLAVGENTVEIRAGNLSQTARWRIAEPRLADLLPAPQKAERGEGFVSADREPTVVTGPVAGAPARTAHESYLLEIAKGGVTITAPTAQGVRYAKATLAQLAALGRGLLPVCKIADWPRFPYRGLMTDCGRNYQSLYSLKRILNHLAAYKYNVYHWHLTDEHGWRLESKKHPELQSEKAFARYTGRFYTQKEFLEVFEYAEKLGILVIPELDVPGHTGAFRRAFGLGKMDSPGVDGIVCDLIDELCSLVPADRMPYVHLGTDEVREARERVPSDWYLRWGNRVTANGRTLLGWSPGHALDGVKGKYVRDVWGWDENPTDGKKPYFDSTGLYYINHVDPLELLSAAAYQQPCRFGSDENMKLGPMIGVWHDDLTQDEHSLAKETAIGPAVVLFSDSFWRGDNENHFELFGRLPAWDHPLFARAADLERRALVHRDRIHSDLWLGFPYVKQTNLRWRMTDLDGLTPSGNSSRLGEATPSSLRKVPPKAITDKISQATVYPWHFRFPHSWFVNRKQGRVALETWIKSDRDRSLGAWIGFTAYSRSSGRVGESGMPPAGWWNRHGSTVELNGEAIAAPNWNNAGASAKGITEVPLTDEEYYLRPPTPIRLKKGWNHVRLVADKHLEKTWKWVATFVPVETVGSTVREATGLEYSSNPPIDETAIGAALSGSVYAHAAFSPVDLGFATWRRVAAADKAAEARWASVKTRAEYDALRAEVRAKAVEAIGGFPEKTPLDAKVVGTVKRDGYTVEKLYYFSRPGIAVPALLYLPNSNSQPSTPNPQPRIPAIVILCGHDAELGKLNPGYQRGAVLAAKAGFAALMVEAIEQGERHQNPAIPGTIGHNAIGVREFLLGKSMALVRLWDAMRAVDYLETRPEIDAKRIGAMGNSGGGTLSAYLSAFDPRIVAGAPSCFLSSIREVMFDIGPQDAEQNIFGSLAIGLNHLGLQLMNDNAILANYSTTDFFPYRGSLATSARAAEISSRIGRGEKTAYLDVPGPHGWKESARTGSVQWMRRWLKDDTSALPLDVPALRALDKTFDAQTADTGLSVAEGQVSPHGRVLEISGCRTVYDSQRERLAAFERSRAARKGPVPPETVRRLAGVPDLAASRLEETVVSDEPIAGGRILRLVYTKRDGSMIPAVLFAPDDPVGVAIFMGGNGRGEFAQTVQLYFKAQKAVLVADLSGLGEAAVPARWYVYGARQASDGAGVMLNLLGEHLVGYRAGEVLGLGAAMKERFRSAPELHATGAAVIPAAHAAYCERGAFRFMTFDNPLLAWSEVVRHPELHRIWLFADSVRGALAHYDWCELLEPVAP